MIAPPSALMKGDIFSMGGLAVQRALPAGIRVVDTESRRVLLGVESSDEARMWVLYGAKPEQRRAATVALAYYDMVETAARLRAALDAKGYFNVSG